MSQTHCLTIADAVEICSKPDHHTKEELNAACTMLAAAVKSKLDHHEDLEINRVKENAAQAYINLYKGEDTKNIKHLEKLLKYLDSTAQLYSLINKQLKNEMPEIGLIAKVVKKDRDIVKDILNRRRD